MPFIYLIMAAIFLLMLACFAIACFTVIFRLVRKTQGPPILSTWVALPLGCGTLIFIVLALFVGIPYLSQSLQSSPANFAEVFGTIPDAEIKNLQSELDAGLDFRTVLLAFDRSDAAWGKVMRFTGDRPSLSESDLVASQTSDGSAPSWWKGAPAWVKENVCTNRRVHSLEDINGWDDIVLIDCLSDGRIYVLAITID